jgi:DNA mismatch endonuclease, patch repair protein
MDSLSRAERSERMSRIRAKDSKAELVVRRLLFSMGYRYRLHRSDLPGRPDLAFAGRRKVIFVHGCFWHQHSCGKYRNPKSNTIFWSEKLLSNKARDARAMRALTQIGWSYLVVWECEIANRDDLTRNLKTFLDQ